MKIRILLGEVMYIYNFRPEKQRLVAKWAAISDEVVLGFSLIIFVIYLQMFNTDL